MNNNSTPLYTTLRKQDGSKVKQGQRAEATASYLEQKHGQMPEDIPCRGGPNIINIDLGMEIGDWHCGETENVIKSLKRHKTPGPDGCNTELV